MQGTPSSYPYQYSYQCQQLQLLSHEPLEQQCQKLLEINTNLTYNISLLELELEAVRKMQREKQDENRKLKEKIRARSEKEIQIKRKMQAQAIRTAKATSGLKMLQAQLQAQSKREDAEREKRVNVQDRKNSKYEQFLQLQQQYRQLIRSIKQRQSTPQLLQTAQQSHNRLSSQIQCLQQCLQQQVSYRSNADTLKRERTIKIKQLNERVQILEKQQQKLNTQIARIQQNRVQYDRDRRKLEEKDIQSLGVFGRLQQIRVRVGEKRGEAVEVQSIFRQLCIEENKIKKDILLRNQCEEERRKYRQRMMRNQQTNGQPQPQYNQQSQLHSHNQSHQAEVVDNRNGKQGQTQGEQQEEGSRLKKWMLRYESIRNKGSR